MWRVVVPVKAWDVAKSRMALSPRRRQLLAEAMTADTLTAIRACPAVARLVVVASAPSLTGAPVLDLADEVLLQAEHASMADAVTDAAAGGAATPSVEGTAVVVADLPALRPSELASALSAASRWDCAMVADHRGTGTTSLTVTGTTPLVARFGQRSADKHRAAGAVLLNEQLAGAIPGLECDVDTREDLEAADRLGLGQRTAEVLRWLGSHA